MKAHKIFIIIATAMAAILIVVLLSPLFEHAKNSVLSERFDLPAEDFRKTVRSDTVCLYVEEGATSTKAVVKAENMSEKIFGIAFGLDFDPRSAEFLKYGTGDFFERGGEPIYISKFSAKRRKLVTGISLKRGDVLQSGSGAIISFYFKKLKPDFPIFKFSNVAISTLAQGKRKNLSNVLWKMCD